MKKLLKNKVVQVGLTAFCVIMACVVVTLCLLNIGKIFGLIKGLAHILMPLIYGLVLAYIMHPLVNLFESKVFNKIKKDDVKRNLSILCTFVIIVGAIVALISFIIPQILLSVQSIIVNAPVYLKDLEDWLTEFVKDADWETTFMNNFDTIAESLTKALNNVVLPFANTAISTLSNGIYGIINFVFNFAIGLVFAIYILANTKKFSAGFRKTLYSIFDIDKVNNFINEVKHVNKVFGQFMIAKMLDSFCFIAVSTFLFLIIFRYPYPLLIAVIIGITDLIPYFGPYIGSVPAALLIFLVDPVKALTFILFIIILQQIDGNLVTPKIQNQATGLPSFWVLFAITLFGGLFGVVGLLIAVPCFTIIYELYVEFVDMRLKKKEMPTDTEYYISLAKDVPKKEKNKKGEAKI